MSRQRSTNFIFVCSTSDGSDTGYVAFGGGGDILNSRGAFLQLFGEQHATNAGQLNLNSAATFPITLTASSSQIKLANSNSVLFDTTPLALFNSNFSFQATTSDSADNLTLTLSGGGGGDSTRGAFVDLHGNETAITPGRLTLSSGATGDIYLVSSNATNPSIYFTGRIYGQEGATAGLIFAGSNSNYFPLYSDTVDGSDTGQLLLTGGGLGGVANTRGAYIQLFGNERTTFGGQIGIVAGSVSGAKTTLQFGEKLLLDGLTSKHYYSANSIPEANAVVRQVYKVTTTDATPNNTISIAVADNTVMKLRISICARLNSIAVLKSYWAEINGGIRRNNGGSAVIVGSPSIIQDDEGNSAYISNILVSGNNVQISLTGTTGETVYWGVSVEYQEIN